MAGVMQTLYENWAGSSGAPNLSASVTLTGGTEVNLELSIAGSTTNQSHTIAIAAAGLQCLYILATVAMTVKTNSSGSPQETITLAAGVPYLWSVNSGQAVPFAGNITAIFITVPGTTAGTFSFRSLAT